MMNMKLLAVVTSPSIYNISYISWGQMYQLPAGMSKTISADLCVCLCHLFQRTLGNTRTCADSKRLIQAWRSYFITIMETPGGGIQMKVPGMNLVIQTPYIFSSYLAWSCPLTNQHSGSRVSTDLPISESYCSIHLPNGSDLLNANSLRGKN